MVVVDEGIGNELPPVEVNGDTQAWHRRDESGAVTVIPDIIQDNTFILNDRVSAAGMYIYQRTYNLDDSLFNIKWDITRDDGAPVGIGRVVVSGQSFPSTREGMTRDIEVELSAGQHTMNIWVEVTESPINVHFEITDLLAITESKLAEAITFDPDIRTVLQRSHVQGSSQQVSWQVITMFNRAENMDVQIAFDTAPGVFVRLPSAQGGSDTNRLESLTIQPREERKIVLDFDETELSNLAAGVHESNVQIVLSAGTITLREGDTDIVIGPPQGQNETSEPVIEEETPPPPPEPEQPPGEEELPPLPPPPEPPLPPPPPEPQPMLTFAFNETRPEFNDGLSIATGIFSVSIANDDATLYSYLWNFDANGAGEVMGQTTAINPTAKWVMSTVDLGNLEAQGWTNRRVTVTATKGGITLQEEQIIQLSDERLLEPPDPEIEPEPEIIPPPPPPPVPPPVPPPAPPPAPPPSDERIVDEEIRTVGRISDEETQR